MSYSAEPTSVQGMCWVDEVMVGLKRCDWPLVTCADPLLVRDAEGGEQPWG